MFSTDTMMRVADAAKGKTSVFIYPEYDRLRQHSHQMIPNHFLRAMTYNVACGATYLNNFPVDQQYFSILYELIAKGGESATTHKAHMSNRRASVSATSTEIAFNSQGKLATLFDDIPYRNLGAG
jgi:hypothetical protein